MCVTSGPKKVKKKKKTSTAHGNSAPTWNEQLVFSVARDNLATVCVEVTAHNDTRVKGDEVIGRLRLSPDAEDSSLRCGQLLRENSTVARWYNLS